MEVSGHLHAPAVLAPEKESPLPIKLFSVWQLVHIRADVSSTLVVCTGLFSVMAGMKSPVKHVSPSAQYTACFIKKFQAPFLTHFNSHTHVLPEIPKSESQTI